MPDGEYRRSRQRTMARTGQRGLRRTKLPNGSPRLPGGRKATYSVEKLSSRGVLIITDDRRERLFPPVGVNFLFFVVLLRDLHLLPVKHTH